MKERVYRILRLLRVNRIKRISLLPKKILEYIGIKRHWTIINNARKQMIATLLPQANEIVDLGGANAPLYTMKYPYKFNKLLMIDLPPEQRHDYYKDLAIKKKSRLGQVVISYKDMTDLSDIPDESVDLVWSGQSIEHVPVERGKKMCQEAYRILKKGGVFALDTPNRHLTKIHTHSIGGGYIHPEHFIEYYPDELMEILKNTGFIVKFSKGICEMAKTAATNTFHYTDFLFGNKINDNLKDSYIQFHYCVK